MTIFIDRKKSYPCVDRNCKQCPVKDTCNEYLEIPKDTPFIFESQE